jgi:hypothetical protein
MRSARASIGAMVIAASCLLLQTARTNAQSGRVYLDPIELPASVATVPAAWSDSVSPADVPISAQVALLTAAEIAEISSRIAASTDPERDLVSGFSRVVKDPLPISVHMNGMHSASTRAVALGKAGAIVTLDTKVRSASARWLRVLIRDWRFPPGTRIRVSGPSGADWHEIAVADLESGREFWTPVVAGDEVWIHIEVPRVDDFILSFVASHVLQQLPGNLEAPVVNPRTTVAELPFGPDANCKNDKNTYKGKVPRLVQRLQSGTALLATVTDLGNSFYVQRFCTGSLVRSARYPDSRFILSANHCFVPAAGDRFPARDATNADVAPTEVVWDYKTATCNARGPEYFDTEQLVQLPRSNGALLRAARRKSDAVLFTVTSVPTPRTMLGWQRGLKFTNDAIDHRVSHPRGYSHSYAAEWTWFNIDDDKWYSVCEPILSKREFSYSTSGKGSRKSVHPGSSGSAIVTPRLRVFGQLYGRCTWKKSGRTYNFHVDGRLSRSWEALGVWLD